jgi:hypothetical protein
VEVGSFPALPVGMAGSSRGRDWADGRIVASAFLGFVAVLVVGGTGILAVTR